ncbi:DUF11 domain-containing protein [Candidatus Gracilibacteria bacterium]|nr:DUF11 domain-containing protein [Candidatus Gracilibacteria bacterium]
MYSHYGLYDFKLSTYPWYTNMMELPHQTERSDSAIDSLEHELYNPKNKMDDVSLHKTRDRKLTELPTSWGDNAPIITHGKEDDGLSFGVKLLLFSMLLLVLALSFTAWRIISLRNVVSGANIDMTLEVNPYVESGEAIPLAFTLFNRNKSPLEEATITLVYKQGTGSQDEQEKIHEKRDLGVINSNDFKQQNFNIILYGSEAEKRDITLKLEYKVSGSKALFSKVITASTVLKTPPVSVSIEGPRLLSIGQNGTYVITVKNNSATTTLPSILQITLPNTFTTIDQSPKSISKANVWNIKSLAPGDSATTTITGSLTGTQGETTSMKALIGGQGDSRTSVGIVYSSQTIDIKLRTSPLNFVVSLETDSGTTEKLRYGDNAVLTITYANTSDTHLKDVSIKLQLLGDAPLLKKVDPTSGYYDSEKRTVTWNSANLSELASLAPNTSGTLRVVVPIVVTGVNSPSLKMVLTGLGSVQETNDVVSTVSKTWVVQGSATINAETKYKDSSIINTGPIPPNPNTETTYTAHLIVSAQNALVNTRVSFILPTYVTWRNVTSDSEKVRYDSRSRTVSWLIGNLEAEKTVSLDVSLAVKPSQSHVGQMPPITSGIVLDADEEISKAHIRTTISPLSIFISGENWDINPSRVVDNGN